MDTKEKWLVSLGGPGKKLLDIGCSRGYHSKILYPAFRVYGIDADGTAIEVAKKKYPHCHFQHGYAENLPFQDNEFDVVLMSEVLEHTTDHQESVNEAMRVLKPGGALLIEVPHKGWFGWLDPANWLQYRHRHYSRQEIAVLLHQTGTTWNIEKEYYRGLLLGPLMGNIRAVLRRIFGKRVANTVTYPIRKMAAIENTVNFGKASYQAAFLIKKSVA